MRSRHCALLLSLIRFSFQLNDRSLHRQFIFVPDSYGSDSLISDDDDLSDFDLPEIRTHLGFGYFFRHLNFSKLGFHWRNMEAAVESIGIPDAVTQSCDFVFRFICACHGLQTGFPRVRQVSCIYWFISGLSAPVMSVIYFYAMTIAPPNHVSSSQVISTLGSFNFMISAFASLYILFLRHEAIEELLQRNGRNPVDVFVPVLARIPFCVFTLIVFGTMREIEILVGFVNFTNFTNLTTTFFMVYLDIVNNLQIQLQELHELCKAPRIDFKTLASEKRRIREQIKVVNSFFAFPLCTHFLEILTSCLFVSATLIGDSETERLGRVKTQSLVGSLLGFLLGIILAAWRASRLIAKCHATERELITLSETDAETRNSSERMELRTLLQYREEWDSLMVGSFELSISNLLRYMATVATYVTVVLQFDFKVVRTMSALASPGKIL